LDYQRFAERLCSVGDWDAAKDAFAFAASAARDVGDIKAEGRAVSGWAHCLTQADNIDDELVLGMYGHARNLAFTTGDAETQFLALAGIATLHQSLRRRDEAVKAWNLALNFARSDCEPAVVAHACTQAASLLLDAPVSMDLANEDNQQVREEGLVNEAQSLKVELSLMYTRAVHLLEEAQCELSKTDHNPKQGAVACMNLATALLKLGGLENERRAADSLLEAKAKLRGCTDAGLHAALTRRLSHLKEGSLDATPPVLPYDPEGHACVPGDPEKCHAYNWARRNITKISEETDSEDDICLVPPWGMD